MYFFEKALRVGYLANRVSRFNVRTLNSVAPQLLSLSKCVSSARAEKLIGVQLADIVMREPNLL